MNEKKAVSAIDKAGALLVFPMDNQKEPESLWSAFFPRSEMRWEWDDSGDNRVAGLWHLRADLSTTKKVVYTKWFRGRATYLSRALFAAMLKALNPDIAMSRLGLSAPARRILEILETESPLSTKELKRMAELKGRSNERVYESALKELWSRLFIVAFGEVDEGAFPSLAIGATQVIYEDLWNEALEMGKGPAENEVLSILGEQNLFYQHFLKLKRATPKAPFKAEKRKNPARTRSVLRFDEL